MAANVEWGPPTADPDGAEPTVWAGAAESADLLEVGRDRLTSAALQRMKRGVQRMPIFVRGTLALVAVIIVVIAYRAEHPAARPAVQTATTLTRAVGVPLPGAREMATIQLAATNPIPLVDYVRSNSTRGACMLVPIGHSPQQAIAAALHRALPEYTVHDVGRTLDEFTAMCAIDVRATDSSGSVLVVEVVAPKQGDSRPYVEVTVGSRRQDPTTTVSMAAAVSRTGWSVTVGAVGPTSDQPSSVALLRVAQDPDVPW